MLTHLKRYNLLLTLLLPCFSFANTDINSLANKFMQQNKVPGLSIAVINNNKITTYNYGSANELTHTKTSNQTIYRIASFSKTYTTTLEALAQVDGKINLDNSITDYLPDIKNNALKPITVKMLASHTGSFPFDFNPAPLDYNAALPDLNSFKPAVTPGSIYSYSNLSIGLNAYILQNVYKADYSVLLHNKITQPLKLTSTYLNLPKKLEKQVALGHDDNKLRPYDRNIDVWFAASSLKSSISDMAKFLSAQFNDNYKDTELAQAIKLVHQNYYCFANGLSCEQLGWQAHALNMLNSDVDDTYFQHIDKDGRYIFGTQQIIKGNTLANKDIFIDKTCGGYGMSGYMLYSPDKKIGVVVLLNKSLGNERIRLGRDILKLQLSSGK